MSKIINAPINNQNDCLYIQRINHETFKVGSALCDSSQALKSVIKFTGTLSPESFSIAKQWVKDSYEGLFLQKLENDEFEFVPVE